MVSTGYISCPTCQRRLGAQDVQCPFCELLLDNSVLLHPADEVPQSPSLIQALLAPPEASLAPPKPIFRSLAIEAPELNGFDEPMATRRMTFSAKPRDVPVVVGSLESMSANISTFEAFVISRMDGQTTVETVRQSTGLSDPEMQAVLVSLLEKKVLRLESASPSPTPRAMRAVPHTPAPVPHTPAPVPHTPAPITQPPQPAVWAPPPPTAVTVADIGLVEVVEDHSVVPGLAPMSRLAPPMAPQAAMTPARAAFRASAPPPPPPAPAAPPPPKPVEEKVEPAPRPGRRGKTSAEPLQEAIALEQSGDIDRAIEVLEQAVAKSKKPAALYNRLGIVLLKQRRDYRRAEEYLNKAATLEPENAVYQQNYVKVLQLSATASGPRDREEMEKAAAQSGIKKLVGSLFSFKKP